MPGTILVEDDITLLLRQLWAADNLQKIAIDHEAVVESCPITDRAPPGRPPLIHLDEEEGVETLQMVAGCGAARCAHSHLAERTGH